MAKFLDAAGLEALWARIKAADNAVDLAAAKIETGSYVGTGKYGSANPNSLTFDIEPDYLFISSAAGYAESAYNIIIPVCALTEEYKDYAYMVNNFETSRYGFAKKVGKTVYWYNGNGSYAYQQANTSGATFNYCCVGKKG